MQQNTATHPFRLFVIEDNRTESMLLQLALSEIKNLTIKTFPTATQMLEHLPEQPDIVLVDLILPDMSGIELIKKIQAYNPHIRIVVVSAQRDIDVLAEVQSLGVFNYLVKSEMCLTYLHQVISELIILMNYYRSQQA
ncbi:response regulator [Rhodoflexus caldus]|uniref:response regulator n=1 Tax=Rhodoflexus caldus TaxID=2891236 RepID=UPI00202AACB2|nr:response regulator [Rhodoflexus caldus]